MDGYFFFWTESIVRTRPERRPCFFIASVDVDHDLAGGATFHGRVGVGDIGECEVPGVEQRFERPRVGEGGRLAHDLSLVLPPAPGQQGQQREDTGVGRPAEGEGRDAVGSPEPRALTT